jgi:cell fate regulator YaaT (PSP1 superfamily)
MRKDEVIAYSAKRAAELRLKDIRILNAEFNYDGTYMVLNYSSQTEEKVDLKSLKYDIQKAFSINNVEIKQLGPRDVAKVIGGMGACGVPCRCCSAYLTEFSSISIKMAKEQGISLTPSEITGMCGRLRCCLEYENDYYVECRKTLPKKKKKVMTPQGEGKVIELFPLRNAVLVDIPEVGRREFTRDQITYDETVQPQPQPQRENAPDKRRQS